MFFSETTNMSGSSDLRALLQLLRISGLAPYSAGKKKRCRILGAYSLFLAASIACNMILAEKDERNNVDYSNKSFIIRITFDSVDVLENIHPCFVIIRCLIYANLNGGIWFKIKRINKKLKNFDVEFDDKKLASFIYAETVIFLILSASLVATDIFLCSRLNIYYTASYWLLCGIPLILNSFAEVTFGGWAWILYQRFWVVNAFLSNMEECGRERSRRRMFEPPNADKSLETLTEVHPARRKAAKVRPPTTMRVVEKPPFFVTFNGAGCKSANVRMIRTLKILHFDLFEVCNELNRMFGWSLLFIFAASFFGCTINMYFVIIYHLRPYEVEQYISSLLWMSAYIFKVLYFIGFSSKVCKEARRTIDLLHVILNRIDFGETQLQVELKAFCLQLSQCKVQFKAAGFFTVDYALLFQFVAGVLSNVVFVVQFDKVNFSEK